MVGEVDVDLDCKGSRGRIEAGSALGIGIDLDGLTYFLQFMISFIV